MSALLHKPSVGKHMKLPVMINREWSFLYIRAYGKPSASLHTHAAKHMNHSSSIRRMHRNTPRQMHLSFM